MNQTKNRFKEMRQAVGDEFTEDFIINSLYRNDQMWDHYFTEKETACLQSVPEMTKDFCKHQPKRARRSLRNIIEKHGADCPVLEYRFDRIIVRRASDLLKVASKGVA